MTMLVDIGVIWVTEEEEPEVEVNYEINNTGDTSPDTTDVWLEVDGQGYDNVEVDRDEDVEVYASLGEDGELYWYPDANDEGDFDLTVHTVDDSDSQETFIGDYAGEPDPPDFNFRNTRDNDPIAPGDTFEVFYRVENLGEADGSTDVWLEANGVEVDRHEDVEVPGIHAIPDGNIKSRTGTLEWDTDSSDAGPAVVNLHCDDDTVQFVLQVEDPPDAAEYVSEGYITMAPREIDESTTWESADDWEDYQDRNEIQITDDESIILGEFPEPPRFGIDYVYLENYPVSGGEDAVFGYSVGNYGDETGTSDIWLEIEGVGEVGRDSNVTLDPRAGETGEFEWPDANEGSHFATLYTEHDSEIIEFDVGEYEPPPYGDKMYVMANLADMVYSYDLSTEFDVTTASHSASFDTNPQVGSPSGIAWNADGSKVYMVGLNVGPQEYDVSEPFDITTATHSASFDVFSEEGSPSGIAWNADGSKMYIVGSGLEVYEYEVASEFDVTTAYHSESFDVSGEADNVRGMAWNADGKKMYVADDDSAEIYEYSLLTDFDVTSASYLSSFDVSSQDTSVRGMAWNADGSKMYVSGSGPVYEYTVATEFDVTTAAHSASFEIDEDGSNRAMAWNGAPQYE